MINHKEARVEEFVLHRIGNAGEPHVFSDYSTLVKGEEEQQFLRKLLLRPFANMAFTCAFGPGEGGAMNRLHELCNGLHQGGSMVQGAVSVAELLAGTMEGKELPGGELVVARFGEVDFGGAPQEAVGIYLFGEKEVFLESRTEAANMVLRMRRGLGSIKPTKACLVLFTEGAPTLLIIDAQASNGYWQAAFIGATPKKDHVNSTTDVLQATKNFITERLPQDFVVEKADQIDLLNRSMEYFRNNTEFHREEFAQQVFQEEKAIESFNRYSTEYQREHEVELADRFEIAPQAVKRQARVFKSVLKLDKNFHIYIHGDRTKIEHGVDGDGRKFYKIYYEQEL